MVAIVLLVLSVLGIMIGRSIGKLETDEITEYGLAIVVIFALLVTIPMLVFSYAYVGYYLLVVMFGLEFTFWQCLLIMFLVRIITAKRG